MSHFQAVIDGQSTFAKKLKEIKDQSIVDFKWYKYDILANFVHLKPMISGELDSLFLGRKKIADIGAADGDLSFFLESLGHSCDIYDFGHSNMNAL